MNSTARVSEGGKCKVLRNIGILRHYTTSQPRRRLRYVT